MPDVNNNISLSLRSVKLVTVVSFILKYEDISETVSVSIDDAYSVDVIKERVVNTAVNILKMKKSVIDDTGEETGYTEEDVARWKENLENCIKNWIL